MILCHHGIKGQKWGIRRYQNKDGSLTKAGKERLIYRNNIIRNDPYSDDVNKIVNSLSDKEKKFGFEQIDVPDEHGWENYNMYIRKTKSYKGG